MTAADRLIFQDRLTDAQVEGLTAYGEARNQPVMGIVAVIASIRNRAAAKHTRTSYQAMKTAAYSCWLDDPTSTNDDGLVVIARALLAGDALPNDPVLDVCMLLASKRDLSDPTSGATHYYNFKTVTTIPSWALTDKTHHPTRTTIIGDHVFYANVPF